MQKLKLLDSSTDLWRHQDNKHHLPKLILHFLAEQLSEDRKEKGLLEFILSVLYLPFKQQKKGSNSLKFGAAPFRRTGEKSVLVKMGKSGNQLNCCSKSVQS